MHREAPDDPRPQCGRQFQDGVIPRRRRDSADHGGWVSGTHECNCVVITGTDGVGPADG